MSTTSALQGETLITRSGENDLSVDRLRAERTDAQLVQATLAGSEFAFEQLFDRHKRLVARTAARYFQRPEQIEEIIQIAFAKAYVELAKFRGEHELSFASWLGRIAANSCLDLLRSQKRRPENLICELSESEAESFLEFAAGVDEGTEDSLVNRDLAAKILSGLPEDDRALLHMYYVDEMSVAEIGELLSWSKSKVKIRAWRARNAVRKIVKRYL